MSDSFQIEACHLKNHSSKNEINVAHTFQDIEGQRWTINHEIHSSYMHTVKTRV